MEADIGQYEVLQGGKFAHMTEPMVSFARRTIWINMGCLKRMPDTTYVHFLLLRQEQKLIIKPSTEDQLDAVRWCTPLGNTRKIICHPDLWNDIISLMGWDGKARYRLLGRFVQASEWNGFAFDMARAEKFSLDAASYPSHSRANEATSKSDILTNQTWEAHCLNPLIRRFENDTLITFNKGD